MKRWKLKDFRVASDTAYRWLVIAGLLVGTTLQAQTLTTLYSFSGGDGATPQSPLFLSGNTLYGGTMFGGANGQGTVFKINTDGTGFATLYSFADSDVDGNAANPYGPLILSQGAVYGTASGDPSGTVFKIKADGSGQSVLHIFSGGLDGDMPFGGVILSSNTLYGTTFEGGNVFKVNTDRTGFASLHCLSCQTNVHTDASAMYAGLVLVGNWLYGATIGGGTDHDGTLFKVGTDGTGYTTLHEFNGSDGSRPWSGLLFYNNRLYGTTLNGGNAGADGVVFAINPDGTGFTNLHQFTGYEGGLIQAGLIASDNVLYGAVMSGGGVGGSGAVFALNTDGTGFKKLYVFSGGNDGGAPAVALTMSGNSLYGTTTKGGIYNQGTIFRLTLPAGASTAIVRWQANMILATPTLQSSTNLVNWTRVSQSPQVVNGRYTLTNPMTGDRRFFRLSQ
jgi:uncharacterized repeat protein (TIGR03803 family)